jgi:hypothetical protein
MLLLIPVFMFLLAAVVVLILKQLRPGFGNAWMVAAGVSLVGFILFLVAHWFTPPPYATLNWRLPQPEAALIAYQLDSVGWIYAFCILSLVLAVFLTAPARLQTLKNTGIWAGSLGITGLGLLAMISYSPMGIVLAWSAIDLLELIILLRLTEKSELAGSTVVAFSTRILGTMLLVWSMALARSSGSVLTLGNVTPGVGLVLLMAAGLRLGVLPLHISAAQEVPMRRGLGTVLRMVGPASSLVLLGRLPAGVVPAGWAGWLLALTALSALYGSLRWLAAEDEIAGRPYWVISLAAMAVACVIRGQPLASLPWGAALILVGGLISLYSVRDRRIFAAPALGLLALIGLPFTPASNGWSGLLGSRLEFAGILFILSLVGLLLGYVRHLRRPEESLDQMDNWVQTVYPLGLFVLAVAPWVVAILGSSGSLTMGVWWASLVVLLLFAGGVVLIFRLEPQPGAESNPPAWVSFITATLGKWLGGIFSLGWVNDVLNGIYHLLQRGVSFITTLLEGAGGMLWVFVLLTLLVSLLRQGSSR